MEIGESRKREFEEQGKGLGRRRRRRRRRAFYSRRRAGKRKKLDREFSTWVLIRDRRKLITWAKMKRLGNLVGELINNRPCFMSNQILNIWCSILVFF